MSSVWVFERGEVHEGASIITVFATKEDALKVLDDYAVSPTRSFAYECVWNEDKTAFSAGCDFWRVVEYHVHGSASYGS